MTVGLDCRAVLWIGFERSVWVGERPEVDLAPALGGAIARLMVRYVLPTRGGEEHHVLLRLHEAGQRSSSATEVAVPKKRSRSQEALAPPSVLPSSPKCQAKSGQSTTNVTPGHHRFIIRPSAVFRHPVGVGSIGHRHLVDSAREPRLHGRDVRGLGEEAECESRLLNRLT